MDPEGGTQTSIIGPLGRAKKYTFGRIPSDLGPTAHGRCNKSGAENGARPALIQHTPIGGGRPHSGEFEVTPSYPWPSIYDNKYDYTKQTDGFELMRNRLGVSKFR